MYIITNEPNIFISKSEINSKSWDSTILYMLTRSTSVICSRGSSLIARMLVQFKSYNGLSHSGLNLIYLSQKVKSTLIHGKVLFYYWIQKRFIFISKNVYWHNDVCHHWRNGEFAICNMSSSLRAHAHTQYVHTCTKLNMSLLSATVTMKDVPWCHHNIP